MCEMAEFAGLEKKVRYFEIAEVAPSLDFAERSSRIAPRSTSGRLSG
jgi:arginase family enzyme